MMRLKIIAFAFFVLGLSFITYGLRPHVDGLAQGQLTDNKQPSLQQIGLASSDDESDVESTDNTDSPFENEVTTSKTLELESAITSRYREMQKCRDSEDSVLQIKCVGTEINEIDDYRSQILSNFNLEFESYINDIEAGREKLSYSDQLIAREILLNESRADLQITALRLLSKFAPVDENLEILEVALVTCTEPEVLSAGLSILSNYKNLSGYNETFDLVIEEQMRLGVSQEITQIASAALMAQMNPTRYEHFKQLYLEFENTQKKSRETSKDTQAAINTKMQALASVLREYKTL